MRVTGSTNIPADWAAFLRSNENTEELFKFLAHQLSAVDAGNKELYTTYDDQVLSAKSIHSASSFNNCNHEEADTRMILHAANAGRCGHSKILLRTVDTDVVVLAVAMFARLSISELWLAFGVGKHYRIIAAHKIATTLGVDKAYSLLFFHAFTGSDTTSALLAEESRQHGIHGMHFRK